jgi:hypothetical protein
MPADYLSRLLGAKDAVASINAFDPFQANLYNLQLDDETLQMLQNFRSKNEWPPHLSKQDQSYYKILMERVFQDRNKLVYVWTISSIQGWHCTYQQGTGKKQCAKPMMEDTTPHTRCT